VQSPEFKAPVLPKNKKTNKKKKERMKEKRKEKTTGEINEWKEKL
jgi:hypothetical protein